MHAEASALDNASRLVVVVFVKSVFEIYANVSEELRCARRDEQLTCQNTVPHLTTSFDTLGIRIARHREYQAPPGSEFDSSSGSRIVALKQI